MAYDYDPELASWADRLAPVDYTDPLAARAAVRAIAGRRPAYQPLGSVEEFDATAPGPDGAPPVRLRVHRPARRGTEPGPGLLYLHWGGFVCGDVDAIRPTVQRLADRTGAVVVAVAYRLAPEHPYPAGLDDAYAALCWTAEHAADLGVDPARLGVGGESAGGGLAAALALLARDRGGPALRFQCLMWPELDDRLETVSARSFTDTPKWNRACAQASWGFYLGPRHRPGANEVPPYAAPARAPDLSGLPPAYVCVCEYDPGRDEAITYAHRLIQAGVRTEIGYYPGTFHASVSVAEAAVSQKMLADQTDALVRGLRGAPPGEPASRTPHTGPDGRTSA
ncbi:alpha/beta hydrolase [Streptomyces luteolus]|uniref:Alpha/beta hydrolase n=1 Tax=Streptomyces luteolus TaxID=3043615 RepID=A0ABT6T414_9ACTN|nr:alpha/beta hydrolase [Streptomyces sp. B-S-A12]MDI3422616.1 alpha/beta hydrolase [Streptomyces sp. B-S-A12]